MLRRMSSVPDTPPPNAGPANGNGARLRRASARFVRVVVGVMLVVLGLLSVPTPLPIGFVLSIVGLAVLAAEAIWIANLTRWLRARAPAFSTMLDTMALRLPDAVRKFVDDTRPEI